MFADELWKHWHQFKKEHKAAITIQRRIRGVLARKWTKNHRVQYSKAILMIQSVMRYHRAKPTITKARRWKRLQDYLREEKESDRMQCEDELSNRLREVYDGTIRIQCFWRIHLAKRDFILAKRAFVKRKHLV
jgi:hypothetical protein